MAERSTRKIEVISLSKTTDKVIEEMNKVDERGPTEELVRKECSDQSVYERKLLSIRNLCNDVSTSQVSMSGVAVALAVKSIISRCEPKLYKPAFEVFPGAKEAIMNVNCPTCGKPVGAFSDRIPR